mgnify:CR=1 FL=1
MQVSTSDFARAVELWRHGESLDAVARGLCATLTTDEKLSMLEGGTEFWEGRIRALSQGQSSRTFPAAQLPDRGIDGFEFLDGPRGVGMGLATCFPVSMARGASFDPALEHAIGDAIGQELRVKGGTLFGGVCVNLLRHPAWGRAQETYGEDPHLVGEMGAALATGVQRHAMACVKHFALNSMETARHRVDVTCDERALHEVYLPHFHRVVKAGVSVVMAAYNSVNGEWCGQSRALLNDILKDEWGFDGVVITDFIFGIRDPVASVKAGLDIEMPYRMIRWQGLPGAIADGRVAVEEVDAIVCRILRTLIRFDQLRQAPIPPASIVAGPDHVALALQAARSSIVLLENRGILPLSPRTTQRIAVLGRLADVANLGDGGSSAVRPPYAITPAAGIRRAFPEATVMVSATDASVASGADVAIVVVGTTMHDEGEFLDLDAQLPLLDQFAPPFADEDQKKRFRYLVENQDTALAEPPGGDRASLKLCEADSALISAVAAVNPRVIVVLTGGSAFVTDGWRDVASAILHIWYPGMEGGTALGEILTGATNPSGHLPFAVPEAEEDMPEFELMTDSARYGLLHGQWWLEALDRPVRYPFGHGLGYSAFRAEALTIDTHDTGTDALVTWRNVGSTAGSDVIQVYASVPGSTLQRPPRRLVGFARVHLTAGQAETVRIPLALCQLAVRDNGQWIWEDLPVSIEAAAWAGDPNALRCSADVGPALP